MRPMFAIALLSCAAGAARAVTIYADQADTAVYYSSTFGTTGISPSGPSGYQAYAGTNGGYDYSYVIPFALPALAPGQQVETASFGVYAISVAAGYTSDLYGLGYRSSPEVLPDDWYSGALDTTDATMIQQGFLPTSGGGDSIYSTGASGGNALADYINAQYAAGAQAGDFVFLRISLTVPNDNLHVNFFRTADLAHYLASIWGDAYLPTGQDLYSPRLNLIFSQAVAVPLPGAGAGGLAALGLVAVRRRRR